MTTAWNTDFDIVPNHLMHWETRQDNRTGRAYLFLVCECGDFEQHYNYGLTSQITDGFVLKVQAHWIKVLADKLYGANV